MAAREQTHSILGGRQAAGRPREGWLRALGANASVAAGPVGVGAEAATQNLSADIVAYSRAKGLYGGVSVEGAVVATRDALNKAYYKKDISPTDILIKRAVSNKSAAPLVRAVAKAAGK